MKCCQFTRFSLALAVGGAAISLASGASVARAQSAALTNTNSGLIKQEFNVDQAQSNRLSIFHDYGLSIIGTESGDTTNIPTDSTGQGLLGPMLGSWASTDNGGPQRSWYVSATPIVGYDSNPLALDHAKTSPFIGADLNAGYSLATKLANGNPLGATFGYDMVGALYDGTVEQAQSLQQTVSASVYHSLADDTIRLNALFDDQFSFTHGKSFLNSIDVHPAVQFFFVPNISIEAGYQFTDFDYFFPLETDKQDPDADRHTASFAVHLFPLPQPAGSPVPDSPDVLTDILRRSLHSMAIGYDHVWNRSDGSDYVYESNRIRFGLESIRFLPTDAVTADFEYAHEWQNYMNFNSLTGSLLVGEVRRRREDHLDVFTTRLNARLADLAENRGTLGTFFQWDVIWDRSNFQQRDFNEYVVSAGVTYRY